MPGDPKECREHAENCRRMAAESRTTSGRSTLLNLADHWERLATELESGALFTNAMDEIKPPVAGE
jgi:hypothetical protein